MRLFVLSRSAYSHLATRHAERGKSSNDGLDIENPPAESDLHHLDSKVGANSCQMDQRGELWLPEIA